MMGNDLISIIVPIYKVQKYLEACVESILDQVYQNIEVILVDDGSPDECGIICDKYAKIDSRIRVIHKINGGLSDARNKGIDIVEGKYLIFVDGDDLVSNTYVYNLYFALCCKEAMMATSWFKEFYDSETVNITGRPVKKDEVVVLDSKECLLKMLSQDKVETSATGKIYDAKIFQELRFPEGKLYEDIPVVIQAVHKAGKIALISNQDYFYLQRPDSIQYRQFNIRKLAMIEHMQQMIDFIQAKYPSLLCVAKGRYLSAASNIFVQIPLTDTMHRRMVWKCVKKYRWDVAIGKNVRKKAKLGALATFAGAGFFVFVYDLTQRRAVFARHRNT